MLCIFVIQDIVKDIAAQKNHVGLFPVKRTDQVFLFLSVPAGMKIGNERNSHGLRDFWRTDRIGANGQARIKRSHEENENKGDTYK